MSDHLPVQAAGAPPVAELSEEPTGSLLGFAKGFGLTFATMFKHVYTEQYPFDVYPTAPRYHGRHVLNRHPDGLEKCVGCELCAWALPGRRHLRRGWRQHRDRALLA